MVAASAKAEVAASEQIAADLEAVAAETAALEREKARCVALLRRKQQQQQTPTKRPNYLAQTRSSHSKVAQQASARKTRPCLNEVSPCVTTRAVAPPAP